MTYFSRNMTVSDLLFFLQTMIQEDPVAADKALVFADSISGPSVVTTLDDSGLYLRMSGGAHATKLS